MTEVFQIDRAKASSNFFLLFFYPPEFDRQSSKLVYNCPVVQEDRFFSFFSIGFVYILQQVLRQLILSSSG